MQRPTIDASDVAAYPRRSAIGVGTGVMLLRDGKVLLGFRNPDYKKASSALHGEGTWTLPGGKLHFGETLEQCVRRETLEEAGLTLGALTVVSVADDIVHDAHFVTIGFLGRDFVGEPQAKEPEKISKWEWFSLSHLPQPLFSASQHIIGHFLAKRVY